jgi:predicted regulator of Ras-like GTPase activity (Roadblock/LC7/MglB family)
MSVTTANVLSALRDIEGVLGSFLIDLDGHMLARDLPPLFNVEALARSGFHLARLRAALESAGSGFDSCVARFGPHLLLLRAAHVNTLCVLCPGGTNLAAVQMSTTLIARRLYTPNAATPPAPFSAGSLGAHAFDEEPDAGASGPARRFRGRSL